MEHIRLSAAGKNDEYKSSKSQQMRPSDTELAPVQKSSEDAISSNKQHTVVSHSSGISACDIYITLQSSLVHNLPHFVATDDLLHMYL